MKGTRKLNGTRYQTEISIQGKLSKLQKIHVKENIADSCSKRQYGGGEKKKEITLHLPGEKQRMF